MTAIGLYIGLRRQGRYAWLGFMGLGYVGAVLLHMLWNATGIGVHFVLFVPLFGGAVAVAIVARHREQKVLLGQLPGMVALGLVTPAEGAWLSTLPGRKTWADQAERRWGAEAKQMVATFAGAVTELSFVRERFERGGGSPEAAQRHAELVAVLLGLARPPVPAWYAPQPPGGVASAFRTPGPPATSALGALESPAIWSPIPGPP